MFIRRILNIDCRKLLASVRKLYLFKGGNCSDANDVSISGET